MNDQVLREELFRQLVDLRRRIERLENNSAPTIPKYNSSHWPQDAVEGQIVIASGIGSIGMKTIPYSVAGTLPVHTGHLRWYALSPGNISLIHASVGSPPEGGGTTIRVNRIGDVTGTDSWELTIADGEYFAQMVPSGASFIAGDYFTVDIASIPPAGYPGMDLVVELGV